MLSREQLYEIEVRKYDNIQQCLIIKCFNFHNSNFVVLFCCDY